MQDHEFEWDDAKADVNYARHRVSFDKAREVFGDPLAIARPDRREDYGEDRFNIIGVVDNSILHVSYTLRGDRIRIISARGAEPHERRRYYKEER
jgi:uncharacterized DUF497 family protein